MAEENTPQTETTLPESATVEEAVALMDKFDAAPEAQVEPVLEEVLEGEDTEDAPVDEAGEGEPVEAEPVNDAPAFWSAEDRAAWATVPPALRPILQKYEQQRTEYANEKAQEAAKARQAAAEEVKAATAAIETSATWWQQNGPQFFKAFGDKWAQVDWDRMADENPAEWARLQQQRSREQAQLQEAHQRAQADIEVTTQRAQSDLQDRKRASHEVVAKKLPDLFGTPEKAVKTYETLGKYLVDLGIPAERVNGIHEAPIIEMTAKAYLYDQAKKQASAVSTAKNTASPTPMRVQPGPAAKPGNQGGERVRQARERISKGGSLSVAEAAALANSLRL